MLYFGIDVPEPHRCGVQLRTAVVPPPDPQGVALGQERFAPRHDTPAGASPRGEVEEPIGLDRDRLRHVAEPARQDGGRERRPGVREVVAGNARPEALDDRRGDPKIEGRLVDDGPFGRSVRGEARPKRARGHVLLDVKPAARGAYGEVVAERHREAGAHVGPRPVGRPGSITDQLPPSPPARRLVLRTESTIAPP